MEEESINSIVTFVFPIIVPIVISIITAYFSTKIAYNKEVQKRIYDEREKTYIVLYELVKKLKNDPFLVYNSMEFLIPFTGIKTKLNLYASQEVLNIVVPFNDKINEISDRYFELFDTVEALNIKEARLEYEDITELGLWQEEELYKEEHVIDGKYVEEVLSDLIRQIRKELKTK